MALDYFRWNNLQHPLVEKDIQTLRDLLRHSLGQKLKRTNVLCHKTGLCCRSIKINKHSDQKFYFSFRIVSTV